MSLTPLPRPSFVDGLTKVHRSGAPRWRDSKGQLYEYDRRHGGELEVYNRQGYHLGVADVMTGEIIKPAVRGRKIDV